MIMQSCQALWDPSGELLLWSERSRGPITEPKTIADGEHPYLAPLTELENYLATIDCPPASTRDCTLFLPSDELGPLVSPKLDRGAWPAHRAHAPSTLELQPWAISALSLSPLEASNFLSSFAEQPPESPQLVFDDSVYYWRDVIRFTLELLSRGSFLPTLAHEGRNFLSKWRFVTDDSSDKKRLHLLTENMPGICRALSVYEMPGARNPRALVESFLETCGDRLIRMFLKRAMLLTTSGDSNRNQKLAISESWVRSLTAETPEVQGVDYELLKLEGRLRAWSHSQLFRRTELELRTVLRLRPPIGEVSGQEDQVRWTVDFLVQPIDDDQRFITARQLWLGQLGFLEHYEVSPAEVEDNLLRDLGTAARIFPEIKRSLAGRYPTELSLSTEEAFHFLRDIAPKLRANDISVILPSWWERSGNRIGLRLAVHSSDSPGGGGSLVPLLSREQLLDFRWAAIVGERELSIDEFRQLTQKRIPLLNLGGEWIELEPERVDATLAFLEQQEKRSKMSLMEALHLGLGLGADQLALPVLNFTATGWVERLIQGGEQVLSELIEPVNFQGTLRPYQREGLSWLTFLTQLGVGGCLADDMGLGKTVQFLAYLLIQYEQQRQDVNMPHQPYLLVVPMSILANWEQEAHRFAPSLRVYVHHGAQRSSGGAFAARMAEADLVITTYSLVFRDEEQLTKVPWLGIALDEAQNIKNLDTKQTQAVRRLARRQMSDPKRHLPLQRIALTGTPLENRLDELWSIFDFLNPGFLSTVEDFRQRFAVPIERHRDRDASQSLSRLLQPFVMRRLKTDPRIIEDLPEKIEMEVITSLTPEQASLYQMVLDDMLPQVDGAQGIHRKGLVLATITRLKQICNHPALYLKDGSEVAGRSLKITRLEQLLEIMLAEGDKALVFTQFAQLGHLLRPYLQERLNTEVLFLHGALAKPARDKMIERFQSPTGPSVFLLSLKAGGFGLNLTEANQVIHVDQWWNPAVQEQATDRAYRIGQKRNVQVRKIICQGTLEQRIAEMLQRKREIADEIVGSSRDWVTQMSTNELRGLLQLTSETLQG